MAIAATTDFAKITTKLTVVKMIITITVTKYEGFVFIPLYEFSCFSDGECHHFQSFPQNPFFTCNGGLFIFACSGVRFLRCTYNALHLQFSTCSICISVMHRWPNRRYLCKSYYSPVNPCQLNMLYLHVHSRPLCTRSLCGSGCDRLPPTCAPHLR